MADAWEPQPSDRSGRWRLIAVMLGIVALAGLLVRPGLDDDGQTLSIERETPTPTAPPTPSPVETSTVPSVEDLPEAPGEWVELGDAPIPLPGSHTGVWTGGVLIVGFQPEVAAYDPEADAWRELPAVPGPKRFEPRVVGAGQHVVVFGGGEEGQASLRTDGMLLDLQEQRWDPIPTPPAAPLWDPAVVWTGEELVVWGGARPGDAHEAGEWPVQGSAFDPEEGRWRVVPEAPVSHVYFSDGVWTGREVVVWGSRHPPGEQLDDEAGRPFAAAYDPAVDAWRELPAPPFNNPAEAVTVWTGQEVVLWGRLPATVITHDPADGRATAIGVALDPGKVEQQWRRLPPIHVGGPPTDLYGFASAFTGQAGVFYGGYPRSVGLIYDPAEDLWLRLPPHRARLNALLVWTGAELLLWGGYTTTGPDVDLWAFRPTA